MHTHTQQRELALRNDASADVTRGMVEPAPRLRLARHGATAAASLKRGARPSPACLRWLGRATNWSERSTTHAGGYPSTTHREVSRGAGRSRGRRQGGQLAAKHGHGGARRLHEHIGLRLLPRRILGRNNGSGGDCAADAGTGGR